MTRKRGKRLDIMTVKDYGEVEIRFDKQRGDFFADVGDKHISFMTLPELKTAVEKAAAETLHLEWIPLIVVEEDTGHNTSYTSKRNPLIGYVSLEFKRLWVAQMPAGDNWISADWQYTTDVDRRRFAKQRGVKSGPLKFGRQSKQASWGDTLYYLPYRGETWQGLLQLAARITELQKKLGDLLASTEGQAYIAELGLQAIAGLLPAPSREEPEE